VYAFDYSLAGVGGYSKMELLLPWFDCYQPANPENRTSWPYSGSRPNEKEACPPKYPFLRIDNMAKKGGH
jgi:hypothetical protein